MKKKNNLKKSRENYEIKKKIGVNIGNIVISTFILILLLSSCFGGFYFNEKTTNHTNSPDFQNLKNPNKENIKENLENMKGFFTKNQGQLDNDKIFFTYSSQNINFGFLESSVLIKISKNLDDNITESTIIKLTFENSNKVVPIGKEELSHKSNYFISSDSSKWTSDVPNYKKIVYENLYDGIDLVYYFNEKGLKYDWVVKANAEPNEIVERFEGIDSIKIDTLGELIIKTKIRVLKEKKPYSYQKTKEKISEIDVSFNLIKENKITYEIGDYDSSRKLIIDPLIYSTYIGGQKEDEGLEITLDSKNNVYVTGWTESSNFPITSECFDGSQNGYFDVFIFKMNSEGSGLEYSTYIGGNSSDYGFSITLDSENNAYVTGFTYSNNFPTTSGCFDDSHNGGLDVFVLKLDSNGSSLIFSTFVGASEYDWGRGIRLDSEDYIYVSGFTKSSDFPTTPGCYDDSFNGEYDIYIFKLEKDGSDLIYSTYIGGNSYDYAWCFELDSENNAYISGDTWSSDFQTTSGCYDDSHNGGSDIFVIKLNPELSSLLYSTYVGGSGNDGYGALMRITVDSENNTYVTGRTKSEDFPTTAGCFDYSYNGNWDNFVFKLNSKGSSLSYSTYIGGNDWEWVKDIKVDSENNAYITGQTYSTDYPITPGCFDESHNGGCDAFVTKLNSDGSSISYSTFIGGSNNDGGISITLESDNNAYIVGSTNSSDFPTTSGCLDDTYNGNNDNDAFIFKLNLNLKPLATIDSFSPDPGFEGKEIWFYGNGTDDGIIDGYEWRSNIDGFLSNKKSFSVNDLSIGWHTIYFRVKDNEDLWSDEVKENLRIYGKNELENKPDFSINEFDIKFIGTPMKGKTIKINANIHNNGNEEGTVTIKFYDGLPSSDNLITAHTKISVLPHGNYSVNAEWTPDTKGNHTIYVVIENCLPNESNIENNQAFKTVEVVDSEDKENGFIPSLSTPTTAIPIGLGILIACLSLVYATENGKYKLLALFFLPLYIRLNKEKVLDHKIRGNIQGYILANPGANYTLLKKELKLANGMLAYHLSVLERERIIKSRNDGKFKRFYPKDIKPPELNKVMSEIRQKIFTMIEENPGITTKELALKMDISRQLMNLHLRVLLDAVPPYIKSEKKGRKIQFHINIEDKEKDKFDDDFLNF